MNFIVIQRVSVLIIFIFGAFLNAKEFEIPEYEKYANEIIKSFALSMEEKLNLECTGEGGRMPRDIEEIQLIFNAERRACIEEARKLEVYIVEKCLDAINSHEKIRPFLREYPFTSARLDIQITFDNKYGHYMDGTIANMYLVRGNICYKSYDPIEERYITLLKESYADALKAVDITSLNPEDLRKHAAKPYESYMDQLVKDFAKEVEKKWGIACDNIGGKWVDSIEEISFSFTGFKKASVEKARILQIAITERLCEILNTDKFLRPYLKEYPFTVNHIRNRIRFYKRYSDCYDYYEDGSVAYVQQDKDKVFYFTQKPEIDGQQPSYPDLLSQEDYETARKLVKNAKT